MSTQPPGSGPVGQHPSDHGRSPPARRREEPPNRASSPGGEHAGHASEHHAPAPKPADAGHAALARVEELEALVTEKDQLVSALIVQLEDAAERIDRMQRMGNDRGARGGGALPREMIEEQHQLTENLQRVVQQWEESQPTAALGRIEMQLAELRDLVAGNVAAPSEGSPQDRSAPAASHAPGTGPAGWESMKAALLAGQPGATTETHHTEVAPAEETAEDDQADFSPPDPPAAIDVANAPIDILRVAVDQRDGYIVDLLRRLRNVVMRRATAAAHGGGDETPEAIARRIEELERAFQEQQRLAEVELSLERARLGREEARLKHMEEVLQKELGRAGTHAAEAKQKEGPDNETPKNRRWRRILGVVRQDEE